MLAVTAAMIVPSLSVVSQGDIEDESKRLRLILKVGLDEAELSGVAFRWLATKQGWSFQVYVEKRQIDLPQGQPPKMEWQSYANPPLEQYKLPQGIEIVSVEQAGDFSVDTTMEEELSAIDKPREAPVLGVVLLLPDGTTSLSNIRLKDEEDTVVTIEVRPGPAGIKRQEPDR